MSHKHDDEDEDEDVDDDDEEEEEEETEERLTADSYGSLDTTQVSEECWLIRIPQTLAQAWRTLPEGTDLGELVFTMGSGGGGGGAVFAGKAAAAAAKPKVMVHVAKHVAEHFQKSQQQKQQQQATSLSSSRAASIAPTNALPLNYSLQAMTKKIPVMHPFSRNPRTGRVKLWGTVSRTANLQVETNDQQYRAMLKDRLVATTIQNSRFVKPVEATESILSKQRPTAATTAVAAASSSSNKASFGNAVLQFGKRKLEAAENSAMVQRQQQQNAAAAAVNNNSNSGSNKKSRPQFTPDQSLRSVLFELFAHQTYWAVKDLKAAAVAGGATHAGTRKGESEIREILKDIGHYHRSGDHKNMWQLREEFQQQK